MSHKYRMVEGGQLFMHRVRMFKQTMKSVLALSFLSILILLACFIFYRFDWYDCYLALMYGWANIKLSLQIVMPKTYWYIDFYTRDLTLVRTECIKLISDPYMKNTISGLIYTLKEVAFYSPFIIFVSIVGSMSFFGLFSKQQRSSLSSKEILRGFDLVEPDDLADMLHKQGEASDLKLDMLPLVKNKETSHIVVMGTTGSGKTNCFHTLLPQIRRRGDSAVVVDTTGDLISKYYREGRDLILNPLDERSQKWNLWEECRSPEELESFAETFISQKGSNHDPFWEIASRKILTTAISLTNKERDIVALYDLLACSNLRTYHEFFEGTAAASFADKEAGKTTLSIRTNLVSQIDCFNNLDPDLNNSFSIRKWVQDDPIDQWLFLTSTTTQRQLLRPLMSAWMNTAVNSLMSLNPDNKRRMWLVVDELPSLNKVSSLKTALAEFRKYGGCILAGFQSFPQLTEVYGVSGSQSMLDLFNTKLMFRTTDPTTSKWVSDVLGETEYAESQENLSFGANSIRDGVSLGRAEKIKKVVLSSEVSNLKDLECLVKYPGYYPPSRISMTYKNIPLITLPFMKSLKSNLLVQIICQ